MLDIALLESGPIYIPISNLLVHSFACVHLFTEQMLGIYGSGIILGIEAHEKWSFCPPGAQGALEKADTK